MPLLGCGEDALTLHAFTSGLPDLFRQLGDPTDPRDSIRFFRPSFGRRGSLAGSPSASPMFGEFDGIIGTSKAVYLIEAKWTPDGDPLGRDLELRPEQRRRHVAFRTYLEEWRRSPPDSWHTFAERIRAVLAQRTQGLLPPSSDSTLARNLQYVLQQLVDCGTDVINVLLLASISSEQERPTRCGNFRIAAHLVAPEEGGDFIRLLQ